MISSKSKKMPLRKNKKKSELRFIFFYKIVDHCFLGVFPDPESFRDYRDRLPLPIFFEAKKDFRSSRDAKFVHQIRCKII